MSQEAKERGRNARRRGNEWMNECANAIQEATGLRTPRELREVRDGTRGDLEVHPRIPHVYECKYSQRWLLWKAYEQAQLSAQRAWGRSQRRLQPAVLLRYRTGPGVAHPRVAAISLGEWGRLSDLMVARGLLDRVPVVTKATGNTPRVHRILQEAKSLIVHPESFPLIAVTPSSDRPNLAVMEMEAYLWMIGRLVHAKVW
jgi:hypothetical protein